MESSESSIDGVNPKTESGKLQEGRRGWMYAKEWKGMKEERQKEEAWESRRKE